MNINYESIGNRIRSYRLQEKLSQEELAELADVSFVYISDIERGEKSASLKTIISLANALNIGVDSLVLDNLKCKSIIENKEVFTIFSDCSKEEYSIITKLILELKSILQQYTIK